MTYQFDFAALLPYWREFAMGVWLTLQLSFVATVLGFVLGTLCAIGRSDGAPWVKALVACYVEVIRNTPLLVQIFIIYFGIATLGLHVDANVAAVLALVVNVGAYTSEIVRAGLESIHKSQLEAAECLGLSRPLHRVVHRPARQHARMHHQEIAFAPGQFALAQPGQQLVAVGRRQNRIERVALVRTAVAFGQRQQVQIVIAEHADGRAAQTFDEAQHRQRIRPAVDQVADQPQPVGCRVELHFIEQTQKGGLASLRIANGIGGHIKYALNICTLC